MQNVTTFRYVALLGSHWSSHNKTFQGFLLPHLTSFSLSGKFPLQETSHKKINTIKKSSRDSCITFLMHIRHQMELSISRSSSMLGWEPGIIGFYMLFFFTLASVDEQIPICLAFCWPWNAFLVYEEDSIKRSINSSHSVIRAHINDLSISFFEHLSEVFASWISDDRLTKNKNERMIFCKQ